METVMAQEALVKTSAPRSEYTSDQRVARMQIKLHRWAVNEPKYRFGDLGQGMLLRKLAMLNACSTRVGIHEGSMVIHASTCTWASLLLSRFT